MDKYEKKHLSNVAVYQRKIDAIYKAAAKEAANIGGIVQDFDPNKPFSFDDYPITRKRIESLLNDLKNGLNVTIINGVNAEWALANGKGDDLVRKALGNDLSKEQRTKYFTNNDEALKAFRERKTNGLSLSDRVWRYTDQFKEEIEMGLDLGIRDGLSADEMSRLLRGYLKYPDKLFRRVKDEYGELHLSQRAAAFHPGRGVYRSSYKNARRLTATETNIAYRTAEYERLQDLDFVVGVRVVKSRNHPTTDICDVLSADPGSEGSKGRGCYPKNFKFTGWHPLCRCHVETILKTEDEFFADDKRIANGEEPTTTSVNEVKELPGGFTKWMEANKERIEKAKTLPFFIKDNKEIIEGGKERGNGNSNQQQSNVPYELKSGSKFLNGEIYDFDEAFFDLIDPSKPIRLEILDSDSGSYSTSDGTLVHIAGQKRGMESPWERKAVIYHEYGHCIDAQRALWLDKKLAYMRADQVKALKKKHEYTLYECKWNHNDGGWYYERVTKKMSKVEYIDAKLEQLSDKIWGMNEETFSKRGFTKKDIMEQIVCTRDTIKSLVIKYGDGHTTAYFKKMRMRETEYLAHAFENTFLGNRVFQKYLPDIYNEMIAYIRTLKPIE